MYVCSSQKLCPHSISVFLIFFWNFADTFGTPLATICESLVAVTPTPGPEVGVELQKSIKMQVFRPWTLHFFEIFYSFFHTALDHHALRYTINAFAITEAEVGVECQKSIKMQVFRLWTTIFFIFLFFFMRYEAPSTPSQQLNWKWAWSVKKASKCRFFISELKKIWKFFKFICFKFQI